MKPVRIGDKFIGPGYPTYVIAEAGVNHKGSLEAARRMIDEAKRAGADAIKFQTYKAEKLVTRTAPRYWDDPEATGTQYAIFKRSDSFDEDDYRTLFQHAENVGITWLSTAFDLDAVRFLDELNAEWVGAARRLSPRLLVELLSFTGPKVCELVRALPPHEPSLFPVAWAGESESENWFDVGREYTERWHHQMQVREAVGAPGLMERRWFLPLLDLSLRALPHAYRGGEARQGTLLVLRVTGEAGGTWSLVREDAGLRLYRGVAPAPAVVVLAPPGLISSGIAWEMAAFAEAATVSMACMPVSAILSIRWVPMSTPALMAAVPRSTPAAMSCCCNCICAMSAGSSG